MSDKHKQHKRKIVNMRSRNADRVREGGDSLHQTVNRAAYNWKRIIVSALIPVDILESCKKMSSTKFPWRHKIERP